MMADRHRYMGEHLFLYIYIHLICVCNDDKCVSSSRDTQRRARIRRKMFNANWTGERNPKCVQSSRYLLLVQSHLAAGYFFILLWSLLLLTRSCNNSKQRTGRRRTGVDGRSINIGVSRPKIICCSCVVGPMGDKLLLLWANRKLAERWKRFIVSQYSLVKENILELLMYTFELCF